MTAITKKPKRKFLAEVQKSFEEDWKFFRGYLTERIGRHTFATFINLIGRIQECKCKEQEYHVLCKESRMWTFRPSFELYIPNKPANAVSEYNRFFEVLYSIFEDRDNNCQMIRLIAEDSLSCLDEYYISLMDLYSMGWYDFKDKVMHRAANPRVIVGAEYKTLRTEECWRLLNILADDDSYEDMTPTKKGLYGFKRGILKDFYGSLKQKKADMFNFKFRRMKHIKE